MDNLQPSITNFIKLAADKEKLLEMLVKWNLIPARGTYMCKNCGGTLGLQNCSRSLDGWQWRCTGYVERAKKKRKKCQTSVGFRTGTIFERSQLTILQILCFVHCWVQNTSLRFATREVNISKPTAVEWASFCRDVVYEDFCTTVSQNPLGGEGKTVEIDELKFRHRKYHGGHCIDGQWVFGAYERGTKRVFMQIVPDRSSARLVRMIKKWVRPGTIIISNLWKAHDVLNEEYTDLIVNYSITFKDEATGEAHRSSIEAIWRLVKATIPKAGKKKSHVPGNLARYVFYRRCQMEELDRTIEFFRMAGQLFNPLEPHKPVFDADDHQPQDSEESDEPDEDVLDEFL